MSGSVKQVPHSPPDGTIAKARGRRAAKRGLRGNSSGNVPRLGGSGLRTEPLPGKRNWDTLPGERGENYASRHSRRPRAGLIYWRMGTMTSERERSAGLSGAGGGVRSGLAGKAKPRLGAMGVVVRWRR